MLDRHRSLTALLATIAVAVTPVTAVRAADRAADRATDGAADAPLGRNLLRDAGFNAAPRSGSPVPGWRVTGDVHTETFGTRSFPYPAYGRKYKGGKRYLSCYGGRGGSVRQVIEMDGRADHSYRVRVRLATSLGGVKGHRVRVSIKARGGKEPRDIGKTRVLEITNHYKKAVTGYTMPRGTERLIATIQLMPKKGSSRCKVMIDTAELVIFR